MLYWDIANKCCDSFRWAAEGPSHTYTRIHSPPDSSATQAATEHGALFRALHRRRTCKVLLFFRVAEERAKSGVRKEGRNPPRLGLWLPLSLPRSAPPALPAAAASAHSSSAESESTSDSDSSSDSESESSSSDSEENEPREAPAPEVRGRRRPRVWKPGCRPVPHVPSRGRRFPASLSCLCLLAHRASGGGAWGARSSPSCWKG